MNPVGEVKLLRKNYLKLDNSFFYFAEHFKKPAREMLMVGMVIELVLNKKGFVVDAFDASLSVGGSSAEEFTAPLDRVSSCSPLPSYNRNELRMECLRIVFDKLSYCQIDNKEMRSRAMELALVMFKELEIREFKGW